MPDTYNAVLAHCGGADAILELEKLVARRIGASAQVDLYSRVSNTCRPSALVGQNELIA
jgi:hypothetical protein